jgi:hypothetical protein
MCDKSLKTGVCVSSGYDEINFSKKALAKQLLYECTFNKKSPRNKRYRKRLEIIHNYCNAVRPLSILATKASN